MQGVKKEGNSNNSKNHSNAPGDSSDPLKGGMEVVQGPCLEFQFCTLEGGYKREKGQKTLPHYWGCWPFSSKKSLEPFQELLTYTYLVVWSLFQSYLEVSSVSHTDLKSANKSTCQLSHFC